MINSDSTLNMSSLFYLELKTRRGVPVKCLLNVYVKGAGETCRHFSTRVRER